MTEAREAVGVCRRECALLGAFLVTIALDEDGPGLRRTLTKVFDDLARGAWDRATAAGRRADRALEEIAALKQRIRDLERRRDDRTVGVGEPGRVM
jgi:hypothetical protein